MTMSHRVDLFSAFIFLGIVQAIFLCLFFFSNENRKIPANFFQGLMIAALAACCFEILLCYTGFIEDMLWLVDYSEPLAFFIGPSFFLMIVCLRAKQDVNGICILLPQQFGWYCSCLF